jgi:hypothetical protein
MKIGDLVKALPAEKWDMDPEDNTHIGVVTKLAPSYEDRPSERIVFLNFGDDDGIFCTSDWKFEVISENR